MNRTFIAIATLLPVRGLGAQFRNNLLPLRGFHRTVITV